MTGSTQSKQELAPLKACTVSRDVQEFDLLIEDMEDLLGEAWGDLSFSEARAFFRQPEAAEMEFIALALDSEDEEKSVFFGEIIKDAKDKGLKVILIAEGLSTTTLHHLLRSGADEFIPYPLPEGELAQTVARLSKLRTTQVEAALAPQVQVSTMPEGHQGVLIATQGLAGGTGATTLAVNLAWELANIGKKGAPSPSVCLFDLDLQHGSIATYLDLPRTEAIFELWSDTESLDTDMLDNALQHFEDKLSVFTSPADLIPLDLLTNEDVERMLEAALSRFDYVIVDMPKTLVNWTEVLLNKAQVYLALLELDMRSAQNALRIKRAFTSEELPAEKLRYVLNRAPKFTDLGGKARIKRMAESLDIAIDLTLPDGGKPVTQASDHGAPLASAAGKNPLRKEIAKLAAELHALGEDSAAAA